MSALKGKLFNPVRIKIYDMLGTCWKGGVYSAWVAEEFNISGKDSSKHLREMQHNRVICSFLDTIPGRAGACARYYRAENEALAREMSRAAKQRWEDEKKEKKKRDRGFDLLRSDEPKYVGAVVPDRATVWKQPAQLAGFSALKPGQYLDGKSWAEVVYG